MILQLSNGPCIAMEIVAKDPNTSSYPTFRNLCGPVDPVSFFVFFINAFTFPRLFTPNVFFLVCFPGFS